MQGNSFNSDFDLGCDLFDSCVGHHGDDREIPGFLTKPAGKGRRFVFKHGGKATQVRNAFHGFNDSRRIERDERLARIELKMARQALCETEDEDDMKAAGNAANRCGTEAAPRRSTKGDTEDFGGVRVIMSGGRIIAAFAGRSEPRPRKEKTRRFGSFYTRQKPQGKVEKRAKTGEELAQDRRRRRKEAKETRWLPALPANHWRRARDGSESLTHDPNTGRPYHELPAAQRDAMIDLRLDELQKQVEELAPELQEPVLANLPHRSWGLRRVKMLIDRLKELETLVAGLPRDFKGTIVHQLGHGLLALPAPLAEEAA